ncbi:12085_t:CDS:2 [Funneliformis mosseae]|uniref:12085_t:CDS:1 n=1 Tax=Funneliformis mosseae TaxID=27381 RepID=A0A9N9F2Y6_FUNMO|nr:12085_t:CDS:2 [Funneliformis mosseae]
MSLAKQQLNGVHEQGRFSLSEQSLGVTTIAMLCFTSYPQNKLTTARTSGQLVQIFIDKSNVDVHLDCMVMRALLQNSGMKVLFVRISGT